MALRSSTSYSEHFKTANGAACGRKRACRMTSNVMLVDCARCLSSPAYKAARAQRLIDIYRENAEREKRAAVAPITLALAEVTGLTVEQIIATPIATLPPEHVASAYAIVKARDLRNE